VTSNGRRVTLQDVAEDARVSASTVSRVLNGDPRIGPETRARVEYVAAQLGYVPNQAARSLVLRATRTLGLLVPEVTDPIHGQAVTGFEDEAALNGYTVIMANGFDHPEREARALQVFARHQADGIAVLGGVLDQRSVLAAVHPSRVVFVDGENPALASASQDLPLGCIRADDGAGVAALVAHLVAVGCRRFAYVAGPPVASSIIRARAIAGALADAGLNPKDLGYYNGMRIDPASAPAFAAQVASKCPDALLCYDDKLALVVLDALRTQGLRVPGDVAVTGFDDIPYAGLANPRLTTVAQPAGEMGRRAVQMLLGAIDTGVMQPSMRLPVQLMVRESSTTPRAARRGARGD
jgi:LacI family transcriptional regulator, galactose operon repressor